MINSYPKIFSLGHSAIKDLFEDDVVIQEKVDGSQFQFGLINGELYFKSKKCEVYSGDNSMFSKVVENISELELHPEWIYRGEVLNKQRHNVLTYNRVPKRNVIIFDINPGLEYYLVPEQVKEECDRIGLEYVPTFFTGKFNNFDQLKDLLKTESCLGGTTIEGIVIKNYHRFGKDKKALMGKWVREEVKEKISGNKKFTRKDILSEIGLQYKTEGRWLKAIQHLKDQGLLVNEPKDIGPLLKEISTDLLEEEENEIKEILFKWAWKNISRIITVGFPEFYKEYLAKKQFGSMAITAKSGAGILLFLIMLNWIII